LSIPSFNRPSCAVELDCRIPVRGTSLQIPHFPTSGVHGGSEFGVDAAVADEGLANAPRDGWNAKRTNSSGLRALSHVNRRSHSCRFDRHLQRGAAWRKPGRRSSSLPTEMPRCPGRSLCFPVRVGIGLLRVTTLAASHLSARGSGAAGSPLVSACPKRLGAIGEVEGRPQPTSTQRGHDNKRSVRLLQAIFTSDHGCRPVAIIPGGPRSV